MTDHDTAVRVGTPVPVAEGPNGDADPGLRERSKARRRSHIQRTAMRLFAERGYDATTVADIAEAADVARRTVSGYFPAKVDLATSYADDVVRSLIQTFEQSPQDDFVTLVDRWLRTVVEHFDPEIAALAQSMNEANPGLDALASSHVVRAMEVGGASYLAYLGLDADAPEAEICGGAMHGIIHAYLTRMSREGPSAQLHELTMTLLRNNLDTVRVG